MKTETGITTHICCAHKDEDGGLHGHTWQITAWFVAGGDAEELREDLIRAAEVLDHKELLPPLHSGEGIAGAVLESLGTYCLRVEVSRPLEGIHARVSR